MVKDNIFYEQARNCFAMLRNIPNAQIKISTLALAEYAVRGDVRNIPSTIAVQSFNEQHALLAGEFGRVCAKSRKEIGERIILLNDSKLFAQAQSENATGFITADIKAQRAYDILKDSGVVSFEFHNIAQ